MTAGRATAVEVTQQYLDRIEVTVRRGLDTRPADEAAHAALHAAEGRDGA